MIDSNFNRVKVLLYIQERGSYAVSGRYSSPEMYQLRKRDETISLQQMHQVQHLERQAETTVCGSDSLFEYQYGADRIEALSRHQFAGSNASVSFRMYSHASKLPVSFI